MGDLFQRGPLMDTSGALLSDWKWIIDNGTSTMGNAIATDTKTTVYEVPADKVYYITCFTLGVTTSAVNLGSGRIWLKDAGKIAELRCPNLANWSAWISVNPRMPIKLLAGEKVEVESSNSNLLAYATCAGYLLDA